VNANVLFVSVTLLIEGIIGYWQHEFELLGIE